VLAHLNEQLRLQGKAPVSKPTVGVYSITAACYADAAMCRCAGGSWRPSCMPPTPHPAPHSPPSWPAAPLLASPACPACLPCLPALPAADCADA
jgi:hypothetical protein